MRASDTAALDEWRPIAGFEGLYEVSDQGRLRSRRGGRGDWHPKADGQGRKGYRQAMLWRDNRQHTTYVHTLVAAAFIGPRPPGMEIAHGNGNNADNRANNLRYATPRENQADRLLHGTAIRGEQTKNHRLTEDQVRAIRKTSGRSQQQMADELGVHRSTIQGVIERKSWKWLADA